MTDTHISKPWQPTQLLHIWLHGMPSPCLVAVDPKEWHDGIHVFVRVRLLDSDLLGDKDIWINRGMLMMFSQIEGDNAD